MPIATDFPADPLAICRTLERHGHRAVFVGGSVRDRVFGAPDPNDHDIATSATPDTVQAIFPRTFVVGKGERHGTVGVFGPEGDVPEEVTTFRRDVETDGRHARVEFTESLEEDLARRDFTINAMAVRPFGPDGPELVDPYNGRQDLRAGVLRAVGNPAERFREDYLRILRGYRFAARFGLDIEPATRAAMRGAVEGLGGISQERIRDELLKLGAQANHADSVRSVLQAMVDDGVFARVLPEVDATFGVTQNEHHAYDVGTHIISAAAEAAQRSNDGRFFLAALLHDIGKPTTRTVGPDDGRVHFYGHEDVGADMAREVCRRLSLSNEDRRWVVCMVRQHMRLLPFDDGITQRALRRIARDLVAGVTPRDLLRLRDADKAGTGLAEKALAPAYLERMEAAIDAFEREQAALRVTDLAIGGRDVMTALGMEQGGPVVGHVLETLLERVIDDPGLNDRATLLSMIPELARSQIENPVRSPKR